jgi:mRNA interferase RelE/StbE
VDLIYDIDLKKPALKFIGKQDRVTQIRILDALEGLKKPPFEGDIKKLKGEYETFRMRIGTFRVLFSVNHNRKQVIVETIGNRGDIY